MPRFCVDLTQTVDTTYRRFVEANSKEEVENIIEADYFDLNDYQIVYDDCVSDYIEIEEIK